MRYKLLMFLFIIFLAGCAGGGGGQASQPPSQPPPSSEGRIFYVSPQGDNSNPGTREQPWATPGYGSRQLQPGDTLVILGGRYILSVYPDDIISPLQELNSSG